MPVPWGSFQDEVNALPEGNLGSPPAFRSGPYVFLKMPNGLYNLLYDSTGAQLPNAEALQLWQSQGKAMPPTSTSTLGPISDPFQEGETATLTPVTPPAEEPWTGEESSAPQWPPTDSYPPDEFALAEENPLAAYFREYQLPGMGGSDIQNWQARQYNPTYATFKARNYLNPSEDALAPAMGFNEYLGGQRPGGSRQRAAGLFQKALTAPEGQQSFMDAMGEDFDPFVGNVLRHRYGADLAGTMQRWLPGMRTRYAADTTGQGVNFLDYVKRRLRLGTPQNWATPT